MSNEKGAFIGWSTDIGSAGLPSMAGYLMASQAHPGKAQAKEDAEAGYNLLGGAFIPGYTGYYLGRKHRAQQRLDELTGKGKEASAFESVLPQAVEEVMSKAAHRVDAMISPTLRAQLRDGGWWKLAHAVKVAQGGAPPEVPTLPACVAALAMKVAADRVNERTVAEGVAAYRRLTEGL